MSETKNVMLAATYPTLGNPLQHASMQGWIYIKIRSTVNVRPRHYRYCILANGLLHTFKFQPAIHLSGHMTRPVRSYAVIKVEGKSNRKHGFLLTAVLLNDGSNKVLEVDVATDDLKNVWMAMLQEETLANAQPSQGQLGSITEASPSVESPMTPPLKVDSIKDGENGAEQKASEKSPVETKSTVSEPEKSTTTTPKPEEHEVKQASVQKLETQTSSSEKTEALVTDVSQTPPSASSVAPTSNNSAISETRSKKTMVAVNKPSLLQLGASVHRGLENNKGENNCFLNVIIQSFWHLRSMRKILLRLNISKQDGTGEINVLSALKDIMVAYEDPQSGVLHPGALRKGLHELYKADKIFEEGTMCDAEETLLTLLNLMHQQTINVELTSSVKDTMHRRMSVDPSMKQSPGDYDPNSIAHMVFGHLIYDRTVCPICSTKSDWDLFSNLVFSVYATELTAPHASMEEMLRGLASRVDICRTCDTNDCNGKLATERVIQRYPMVFAISLLWATSSASKTDVEAVLKLVKDKLDLSHSFTPTSKSSVKHRTVYSFRGFVCYYGQHYFAFFYSTAHKQWLLFDDSKVAQVGAWENVVDKCLKGRYQPVLLFYEIPDKVKDSSLSNHRDYKPSSRSISFNSNTCPSPIVSGSPSRQQVKRATTTPKLSLPDEISKQEAIPEDSEESKAHPKVQELRDQGKALLLEGLSPSESNTTFDISKTSAPYVAPVASAVAMQPRNAAMQRPLNDDEYQVQFTASDEILGLYIEQFNQSLCVTRFPRGSNNEQFAAEKCQQISLYDRILSANGHPLAQYNVDRAIQMIQAQSRPLTLRFQHGMERKQLQEMGFPSKLAQEGLVHARGNISLAANYCFENQK